MIDRKTSYGLAILSGILLLFSFPPFNLGGFLAWFALVPLTIAVDKESETKRISRLSRIAGLGCVLVFIWLAWWVSAFLSWIGFIAGLLFGIALACDLLTAYIKDYWKTEKLASKNLSYLSSPSQIFIIPLVATATEFLLMNIPGVMRIGQIAGFFSIAKTQWANPAIMHLASFTGMYGVTFLVLLVNCAIAYGIIHYKETKKIFKPTVIVLCLFAIIFAYGLIDVPSQKEGDVTVAVIQSPLLEGEDINDLYLSLSKESLKYQPRIVVWPFFQYDGLALPENFTQEHDVYLAPGPGVISPDGNISGDNLGYHMITLFTNIADRDVKGLFFPEVHSLDTDLGKFAFATCIESGSTLPTRERVNDGAQFLIVPTGAPNTYVFSWALGTNAIYRAVEHKVFAVEVIADHDSSMIIDPYGRIIKDAAPEPEIVVGKISFTDDRTFYTKYGDGFGWTIVGLAVFLMIYNSHLKRKSPFKYCKKCRAKIEKDAKTCPKCGTEQRPLWKRFLF